MADQSLTLLSRQDWVNAGIAKGSDAEKAMLVDVAYAAKAFKALKDTPEFKGLSPDGKVDEIKNLVHNVIDDRNHKNPFVTDKNTKQVIKNYADELVKRSTGIDDRDIGRDGKHKEHGFHAQSFLTEASNTLNSAAKDLNLAPLLDDNHIEDTVQRAHSLDFSLMLPANDIFKQLDHVREKLDTPEHIHLGVEKGLTLVESLDHFTVKTDQKGQPILDHGKRVPNPAAFVGTDPDAEYPAQNVDKDEELKKKSKGQGEGGIFGFIMALLAFLSGKTDNGQSQGGGLLAMNGTQSQGSDGMAGGFSPDLLAKAFSAVGTNPQYPTADHDPANSVTHNAPMAPGGVGQAVG